MVEIVLELSKKVFEPSEFKSFLKLKNYAGHSAFYAAASAKQLEMLQIL